MIFEFRGLPNPSRGKSSFKEFGIGPVSAPLLSVLMTAFLTVLTDNSYGLVPRHP